MKSNNSTASKEQINRLITQGLALSEAILQMREKIQYVQENDRSSSKVKSKKLAEMCECLRQTEQRQETLCRELTALASDAKTSTEDADDSEETGYFQWTDPETPEEAWRHIQGILPILDEMKAKIKAIEVDPKIPLREKAERLAEMKEAVEFVSRRVVALSEAWLEAEAA